MSKISLKHSGGKVVSLNSPTTEPNANDVAFKLPNADGSAGQFMKTDGSGNLAFAAVSAGITHARMYRQTSTFSLTSANDVLVNFEYVDETSSGHLGTGWSLPSSGVFSFPTTGIYMVRAHVTVNVQPGINVPFVGLEIKTTTDNSSYGDSALTYGASQSDDFNQVRYHNIHVSDLIDCTDTSNVKFKIGVQKSASYGNVSLAGDTNLTLSGVEIIRLGDT